MIEVLRLVRFHNLMIAAAGVLGGGWIALGRVGDWPRLLCAAGVGMGLGAYGFIRNDIDDAAADRTNRPTRPIPSGHVAPARAARYASRAVIAALLLLALTAAFGAPLVPLLGCALAAGLVMRVYSRRLKRVPGLGNLAVALIAGLPLFFGAVVVGRPGAGLVPWVLAAWIHLIREVVKDLGDEPGDRAVGRRTLPIALGIRPAQLVAALAALLFVPASLALPHADGYRGTYFLLALPAQLAVVVAASRLVAGRSETAARILKGAMVVGIVALVAGRLA